MPLSDEELVGRLVDGREDALTELLARWDRPLSSFLHRHTQGRDVADLFQETWMRVVVAAPSFDRHRKFSTWLFQIAINLCRDWHRKHAHAFDSEVPIDSVASARIEAKIDAERLLGRLPELQREALILRYYHDFTEDEIAAIAGCPRGTVKSRIHVALKTLSAFASDEAKK